MINDDPLSVILITRGSQGLKLLFRYPFSYYTVVSKKSQRKVSVSDKESFTRNPYSLIKYDIADISARPVSREGQFHGFEDNYLATMLAPMPLLCEQNFQLKIEDVKFVGFPVLVNDDNDNGFEECLLENTNAQATEDCMVKMVHVVFVLACTVDAKSIAHYQGLSKMLGKGLRHEEKRCRYLSLQREIMVRQALREEKDGTKDDTQEALLSQSTLARDLVKIYHSIQEEGTIEITLNGWLNLSYCFPRKINRIDGQKRVFVDGTEFNKYIWHIKPYHTMLLTNEPMKTNENDRKNLFDLLPPDASPVLDRLIKLLNKNKMTINFQNMCQDEDISLPQIFQVVAHLVYWGKCTVIYPLAESNVYVLSDKAPTHIGSKYAEEFALNFPSQSLHTYLARFSVPMTLGELRNPLQNASQQQETQIVTWLLKRHLLKQIHTYVLIMPPSTCDVDDDVTQEQHVREMTLNIPLLKNEKQIFDLFSDGEKRILCRIQSEVDKEDMKDFLRMSKYFRGEHHLEYMMFYENMLRARVLELIDKFRSMLITVQHEDLAISMMI